MKAADYIARYLEHRRVTHVFELIGGMITFLLDSLHQQTKIQIVSMHHEQGAGFAAEGYGRMSDVPGVAMATSGPGATNLLTAIASCYFDSTPAVFITGQVNRHEQKGDRAIRQLGFQETDIVAMAVPVTKAAWLVNNPDDLPRLLEEAFALAISGRPGPVLIDIPMDVQRAEITDLKYLHTPASHPTPATTSEAVARFWANAGLDITRAKCPLILAGGGIRSSNAINSFRIWIESLQIPVVHSLMAVDVLPAGHPLRVGLIGSYGNRWANIVLSECDLLLVVGSRLDVRQTGADTDNFKANRLIYHVDCELGELNNRVKGCHPLVSELPPFFSYAQENPVPAISLPAWTARIAQLKAQWPDTGEQTGTSGINPNELMHQISALAGDASAFVVDVGQHQMWAAQSLDLGAGQRFLTSGGMGAMGFALPAAIGACLATAGRPVVVIAGDGGIQLNIQELQTVVRQKLPMKIIVLNNQCHGMVRQFQESYFKGRYQSTLWGYTAPSFKNLAQAYGIASAYVSDPSLLLAALSECWADPNTPFLLEVGIATEANAYPKMAFGQPISEMEPFAKPLEMEGT